MSLLNEVKNLLTQGKVMAIHQMAKERKLPPDQIQRLIDRAGKELQKTDK